MEGHRKDGTKGRAEGEGFSVSGSVGRSVGSRRIRPSRRMIWGARREGRPRGFTSAYFRRIFIHTCRAPATLVARREIREFTQGLPSAAGTKRSGGIYQNKSHGLALENLRSRLVGGRHKFPTRRRCINGGLFFHFQENAGTQGDVANRAEALSRHNRRLQRLITLLLDWYATTYWRVESFEFESYFD